MSPASVADIGSVALAPCISVTKGKEAITATTSDEQEDRVYCNCPQTVLKVILHGTEEVLAIQFNHLGSSWRGLGYYAYGYK